MLETVKFFLSISFNICFGCSKEPSHQDGSFEYPQHMFWWRNKKINFYTQMILSGHDDMIFFVF